MFTGIIEEVGVVKGLERRVASARLTVKAHTVCQDLKVGDSVAVNGACLTVVKLDRHSISFDVMEETLKVTNLGKIKIAQKVNLERALKLGDRLSGHLISGHINGMGRLVTKQASGRNLVLRIATSIDIMRYLIPKGSVAVDGISLTIVDLGKNYFTAHIIPHTLKMTNLDSKKVGDMLNLEIDLLGKFVHKYLAERETRGPKVTKEFLAERGF